MMCENCGFDEASNSECPQCGSKSYRILLFIPLAGGAWFYPHEHKQLSQRMNILFFILLFGFLAVVIPVIIISSV
jgi:hypothetical protein